MRFVILLLLLGLPLAEIAVFIAVGSEIGVVATIGLIFLTAFIGIMLLRIQGMNIIARLRQAADAGAAPEREVLNGMMIMLAGLMLLLPGFITDTIGLVLFLPPTRALAWRLIGPLLRVTTFSTSRRPQGRGPVVDLDTDEFERRPKDAAGSPWRTIDADSGPDRADERRR